MFCCFNSVNAKEGKEIQENLEWIFNTFYLRGTFREILNSQKMLGVDRNDPFTNGCPGDIVNQKVLCNQE